MRRWPAVLWLPVYIGSLLILNGAHGRSDPGELVAGIGLAVLACCLAMYVALGPWRGHPRPKGGLQWAIGGVVAFYVVCAVAAGTFAGWTAALASLLAGVIPLTAVAIWIAMARSKTVAEGGARRDRSAEDSNDPYPGIGVDDARPMGDTPQAHDEISPHDLPRDTPARRAARLRR
jgi:hypothetical protein